MSDVLNPIQSTSYTSKDFQTIFPELLDLAKVLTSRWDPSMSNESDPGVVLLKLNAIIADKLNYNIDKNVLECFPLSVTQEKNARQLFDQLGYRMSWYKSAIANVSIKWNGDVKDGYVTIPAFTMVSDANNSVIYTLVGSPDGVDDDKFAVGSQNLYFNGNLLTFKAIQGIAITYDINGETTIRINHLDSNNRIYFNSYDVAENGIFITNVGQNNYTDWVKKDNLTVESLNNTYYSFGLSEDGTTCYIQFPDDAENVIKDGVNITYIKSTGTNGNIGINMLEKFYNDLYLTDVSGANIVLDSDNVKITNYSSSSSGSNPETINEAYHNYKRVIGTFDTLVTLRDYINYIIRSGLVSNCFVCDRTNDIQCTYSIMTLDNEVDSIRTVQEQQYINKEVIYNGSVITADVPQDTLSAFSIKLYLLENVSSIDSSYDFDDTFNLLSNSAQQTIKYYLEDQRCISHDYEDLLPATSSSSHVCFFKNKYPINCRIITKYQLTTSQAAEVSQNVRKAFFDNLNAKKIDFSDSITLELINDLIVSADERIKTAIIDNIEYQTWAVYFDGSQFQEVNITESSYEPVYKNIIYAAQEYDNTSGYIIDEICQYKGVRYKCISAIDAPAGSFDKRKWVADVLEVSVDEQTFTLKIGYDNYSSYSLIYDSGWKLNGSLISLSEYGITINGTPENNDNVIVSLSTATQIRDEVFAKSVLAGVTPLFEEAGEFDYTFNQLYNRVVDEVDKVKSGVDITLTNNLSEYQLKTNESLQFYAPNFINGTSYSNYVKFEWYTLNKIVADSDYQLQQNEYVIFYWKTDDDVLNVYNYYVYAEGNIIHPSFTMEDNQIAPIGASLASSSNLTNVGTEDEPRYVASSELNGPMNSTISDGISALVSRSNILSGVKTITTRRLNQISLDSSYYCYWVLNDKTDGNYVLFSNDEEAESQTYLLNTGEYFFYSNSSLTELGILGSGTTISRNSGQGNWIVSASINLEDILENGTNALKDVWQHPLSGQSTIITENQYITVSTGSKIKLTRNDGTQSWTVKFKSDGVYDENDELIDLSNYTVQYQSKNDETWVDINSINIDSSYTSGWNARSLLSLNISSTVQQRLLENQYLTLYLEDGTTETINGSGALIDEDVSTQYYYPYVVRSKLNAIYDGGGDHTVSQLLVDDSIEYDSIYIYRENISRTDGTIRVNSYGDLIYTFDPETTEISTNFILPAGDYMFRLNNSSLELTSLKVLVDDVELAAIYNPLLTTFHNVSNAIIYLNIPTTAEHTLTVRTSAHTTNATISILNPFNFKKVDNISTFYYNKIRNKIINLDNDNVFNYLYQVNEDDSIKDPLLPSSFLETNHIFNNYVICQLDVSNSNIYILNKK